MKREVSNAFNSSVLKGVHQYIARYVEKIFRVYNFEPSEKFIAYPLAI